MNKPQIELMDVEKLIPYELNSKVHDEKQIAKIATSIKEFGWDQPIVVDEAGSIIKGHGRRLAAISLGIKQVPVLVRRDLTPDQVRAARLADNRVAQGLVDTDMLQKELAELSFDLSGIFDAKELEFMNSDLGEINVEAFVENINVEIAVQAEESTKKVAEVDDRAVRIDLALGFKTIRGSEERDVAKFVAVFEEETGMQGADAFVAFAKSYVESLK